MKKYRILIISFHYTPANNPVSFRWTAIGEYWAKRGHQVDIVCGWLPGLSRYEVLNGIHVYRVGGAITEVLRKKFRHSTIPEKVETSNSRANFKEAAVSSIKVTAKWIHDNTWKKVYWPDTACLWYLSALKETKTLLRERDYNSLISVSEPFTGHLVGLTLKKIFPRVTWMADISDPFSFIEYMPTNNHKLYKKLNYFVERKIFNQADAISVTTKPTLEKYAELFTESKEKINIIPQLVSLDPNLTEHLFNYSKNEKIRLIFVGTLFKSIRKPDFLLRLYKLLLNTYLNDRLELHFYGNMNDCQEYFSPYEELFDKKIFYHGIVSREKAIHAMIDADILVNIGNESPYELPSKVVEYANLGKPVLNLAKMESDTSIDFFKEYPASLCLVDNGLMPDSELVDKLVDFIEKPPHVELTKLQQLIEKYQIKAIATAYEKLVFRE